MLRCTAQNFNYYRKDVFIKKKTEPSLRDETQINHITRTVFKLRLKPKTKMRPREKPEAELGCGKGGAGVKNVKLDDNEVRRPVR